MSIIDWFKFKDKLPSNVVPFPPSKEEAKVPYVVPPSPPKEKEHKTYYMFGLTDDNRVSFQMGYATLTMNAEGVQDLIDQLEFFKNKLREE